MSDDPQRQGAFRQVVCHRKGEESGFLRHLLTDQSKNDWIAYLYVKMLTHPASFRDVASRKMRVSLRPERDHLASLSPQESGKAKP